MPETNEEAVKIHGLRRLVRDFSLPTAHGDSACARHSSSDTGTLLVSHSQASTALESWGHTAGITAGLQPGNAEAWSCCAQKCFPSTVIYAQGQVEKLSPP